MRKLRPCPSYGRRRGGGLISGGAETTMAVHQLHVPYLSGTIIMCQVCACCHFLGLFQVWLHRGKMLPPGGGGGGMCIGEIDPGPRLIFKPFSCRFRKVYGGLSTGANGP